MSVLRTLSARLNSLSRRGGRSALSLTSGGIAVVLIVGGVAFAAQEARNDQVFGPGKQTAIQKAAEITSETPMGTQSPPSSSSTQDAATTTQPPTTILGPNGETLTLPTAPVPSPDSSDVQPGNSDTRNPTLIPDTTDTTTPARPNDDTTTTTQRPIPNQEQPQLDVSIAGGAMPEDPVVSLDINVSDADGYVTSIDVTWDAGEAPENIAAYGGNACDDPPPSSHSINAQHTYVNPGTHSVSVTVTTVSCDGTTQQASRSASVTSGGTTDTTGVSDPILGLGVDIEIGPLNVRLYA